MFSIRLAMGFTIILDCLYMLLSLHKGQTVVGELVWLPVVSEKQKIITEIVVQKCSSR